MELGKYSFGVGDRFGRQGKAQLRSIIKAQEQGVDIVPVWNKSHREHTIIKTLPADVRIEADEAVKSLGWKGTYHVDADHIGLKNVDLFVPSSDFYTIDVADSIGRPADEDDIKAFVSKYEKYSHLLATEIEGSSDISREQIEIITRKYLLAVKEAGKIYQHIKAIKGQSNFIAEVSMDEADEPQTAVEMFFILAAIAEEGIAAQTIAPKFTGRFNKGVDYIGRVEQFAREFEADLAVIKTAVVEFGLPENLKLSIHSGSDKFSIYGPINKALKKTGAGLHIKTAGTTWLEELIGLAMAGGEGLKIAKNIYHNALGRFEELCGPYSTVIDIDKKLLPPPEVVEGWTGQEYANTLRHNQRYPQYNLHFRQLLHVGYKIAAEMGDDYLKVLDKYDETIAENVTENIYERHIKPVFM
ncbi:MAG: hypothetical protein GWP14_00755 [Actinobacteria bacterium]|nr:hypothetical protein [Actinomycetota bacterium]